MPYDETMVAPMRAEITRHGVKELRSAADVDTLMKDAKGSTLIFVNSVCGCAAGGARPGLSLALGNAKKPQVSATVFAGQDVEATAQARSYMVGYRPSSPSIALFKDGKLAFMMERQDIEGRMPQDIAKRLVDAFEKHC